jgi:hypothetical protein
MISRIIFDLVGSLFADAGKSQKPLGSLFDYGEDIDTEGLDEDLGKMGSDPLDYPGAEILLDSFQGTRGNDLEMD